MRNSEDEKKLPERYQSRAIRDHQAVAGKRAQENLSQAHRTLRGALPVRERLPVAHAARGVFQVAHCAHSYFMIWSGAA